MIATAALLALMSAQQEPPVLDIAGCEVRPSVDSCVLKNDRKLVIISSEPGDITYDFGGTKTTTAPEVVEGWYRLRVLVPPNAAEIRLGSAPTSRKFHFVSHPMAFADEVRTGSFDITTKFALLGDLLGTVPLEQRAYVLRALARLEYAAGRPAYSLELSHEAIKESVPNKQLSLVLETRLAASHLSQLQFDYRTTSDHLKAARPIAQSFYSGLARWLYHRSNHDQRIGNISRALVSVRRARSLATVLDNTPLHAVYTAQLGNLLAALGRSSALEELHRAELLASGCQLGRASGNLGWVALLFGNLDLALSKLEAALKVYETNCPNVADIETLRISAALAYLAVGKTAAAKDVSRNINARTYIDHLWTELLRLRLVTGRFDQNQERTLRKIVVDARENHEWDLAEFGALELAERLTKAHQLSSASKVLQEALSEHYAQSSAIELIEGRLAASVSGGRLLFALIENLRQREQNEEAAGALKRHISELGLHVADGRVDNSPRFETLIANYRKVRANLRKRTQERWLVAKDVLKNDDRVATALANRLRDIAIRLRSAGSAAKPRHQRVEWPRPTIFVTESRGHWIVLQATSPPRFWTGSEQQAKDFVAQTFGADHSTTIAVDRANRSRVAHWLSEVPAVPSFAAASVDTKTRPHDSRTSIGIALNPTSDLAAIRDYQPTTKVDTIILRRDEVTPDAFRRLAEQSKSLIYVGHHDQLGSHEDGLRLANNHVWSATDVRVAARLPKTFYLIACESIGNEAGLVLADELMRRGVTEVVSTTRLITPAEALRALTWIDADLGGGSTRGPDLPLVRLVQLPARPTIAPESLRGD